MGKKYTLHERHVYYLLCLILLWGWAIRSADVPNWLSNPERMLFQGKPLLASVDGYYFLDLSRNTTFAPEPAHPRQEDLSSSLPAHVDPAPPRLPLPAHMIRSLVRVWDMDPLWIAAWSGPVLAPLLAIPLFFLGRYWGGRSSGLAAALLGVTAPLFVQRTAFGYFDTDMLIPTLFLVMSLGFLHFARGQPGRMFPPLLLALGGYGVLLWWWDRAPAQILGMQLSLIMMSWLVRRFSRNRAAPPLPAYLLPGYTLLTLGTFYLARGELPSLDLVATLKNGLEFFLGAETSSLPPTARIIEEFHALPWQQTALAATGHPLTVVLGCIGLLLLTGRGKWEMVLLLPVSILGVWGLLGAMRLLIFTGPLLALGIGHLTGLAWKQAHRWHPGAGRILVLLGVLAALWPALRNSLPHRTTLDFSPPTVAGMAEFSRILPPQAWIWSLWDAGHPLRYWSQRAVVFDGHVDVPEAGERLVYNTLPFATPDAVFSARFMLDYTARGLPGMRQRQQRAHGDWDQAIHQLREAPPPNARTPSALTTVPPPVYVFLFRDMLDKSPWWYPFATWSFTQRRGIKPFIVRLTGMTRLGDMVYFASATPARALPKGPWQADLNKGVFLAGDQTSPLMRLGVFDASQNPQRVEFSNHDGLTLLLDSTTATGYLLDRNLADSLFIRLWFFQDPPAGTFRPVRISGLDHQLWEVVSSSANNP
ncbi:MAG: hypothetical protein HQL65_07925 [Magnetococcales bacterium]|nr:hypothetical protein [Magnetococcales bacterium]